MNPRSLYMDNNSGKISKKERTPVSDRAMFRFVRSLRWEDVFEIWRNNEENSEAWKGHYQEKGFASWKEWRLPYVKALRLPEKKWALWQVTNPMQAVPEFRGGPFRSWLEQFYEGRVLPTFTEIAANPKIAEHHYIIQLVNDFPRETTITGLRLLTKGVVVIEGMHRAAAIALAIAKGKKITTVLSMALAEAGADELPIIGHFRKK